MERSKSVKEVIGSDNIVERLSRRVNIIFIVYKIHTSLTPN
jgi:hypothetical protein